MFKPSSARADVGLSLVRLGIVLILLGLGYYFLWPRTFEATAKIKVEKDYIEVPSMQHGFDPYWVPSEFERIQAKVVLYPVITNLNLTSKWAPNAGRKNELRVDEVYPMLREKLFVRQLKNTALIEIRVRSNDAREAAELASAIATTFRENKLEDRIKMHAGGIRVMEELLQKEAQRMSDLEKFVRDLSQVPERAKEYEQQKAELDKLRTFCEKVIKKIQSERETPVNSLVHIIDPATMPAKAIRPNPTIVLLLVGGGSVLVVLGLALMAWPKRASETVLQS